MDYTDFSALTVSEVVKTVEVEAKTGEVFRVEIRKYPTAARPTFKARYFERKYINPKAKNGIEEDPGTRIWAEVDRPWVDMRTADEALADALDFLE